MKYFFNLAFLRKKWPNLVLYNWRVVTNFLVKAVTQVLLFSGVTAFNSLSSDFRSMLVPRSVSIPSNSNWGLEIQTKNRQIISDWEFFGLAYEIWNLKIDYQIIVEFLGLQSIHDTIERWPSSPPFCVWIITKRARFWQNGSTICYGIVIHNILNLSDVTFFLLHISNILFWIKTTAFENHE